MRRQTGLRPPARRLPRLSAMERRYLRFFPSAIERSRRCAARRSLHRFPNQGHIGRRCRRPGAKVERLDPAPALPSNLTHVPVPSRGGRRTRSPPWPPVMSRARPRATIETSSELFSPTARRSEIPPRLPSPPGIGDEPWTEHRPASSLRSRRAPLSHATLRSAASLVNATPFERRSALPRTSNCGLDQADQPNGPPSPAASFQHHSAAPAGRCGNKAPRR